MNECHIRGCRTLETKCKDCGHLVADRIFPKNEWIKVEDKFPECENVLAICVSDKKAIYNMRHDGWFRDTIYSCRIQDSRVFIIESHGPILPATHWMPLPGPPT